MICVYEKSPRLRHVGHLDLLRAMQRALRRSDLPISFSKGFNPHLLLSFAAPLSVGVPGKREVMEVPLESEISEEEFLRKFRTVLPPELPCLEVHSVDDHHPAPMALLRSASYEITPLQNAAALFAALPEFLGRNTIMTVKKSKSGEKEVDIRPMIYNLYEKNGTIYALLALCEASTCKPDLLISELSKQAGLESVPRCSIVRTALYGDNFKPLETL